MILNILVLAIISLLTLLFVISMITSLIKNNKKPENYLTKIVSPHDPPKVNYPTASVNNPKKRKTLHESPKEDNTNSFLIGTALGVSLNDPVNNYHQQDNHDTRTFSGNGGEFDGGGSSRGWDTSSNEGSDSSSDIESSGSDD